MDDYIVFEDSDVAVDDQQAIYDRAAQDDYDAFLRGKVIRVDPVGFEPQAEYFPEALFPFQRKIVEWAIRRGRAAIFADCGLGKTPMQLTIADQVIRYTSKPALILAPLGVVPQTVGEGRKFGFDATPCRSMADVRAGINVTNYEMLHKFDTSVFGFIGLDESSILKAYDGATRQAIIAAFQNTLFRYAFTATPAPNDHVELGNHAEFLGVMTLREMKSHWFVHDMNNIRAAYRLMAHAEHHFWAWMAQWAVMIRKPSDLGFDDTGFDLPGLAIQHEVVDSAVPEGMLIPLQAKTLTERRRARRASLSDRVQRCVDLVNQAPDEKWLIWCNLNDEQNELEKAFGKRCVSVQGSTKPDDRIKQEQAWRLDDVSVMISKPSVFGFGMNWQHCHNVVFVGLSDSYEQYYQAIRRVWRFGQTNEVQCFIITSESEGAVVENINRKEQDANKMATAMAEQMQAVGQAGDDRDHRDSYQKAVNHGDRWQALLGDCVEAIRTVADNSVDYSIFSPPFKGIYLFSQLAEDMSNSRSSAEFYQHYTYLIREQFRTLKPGRLLSFHCMNLPTTKNYNGVIGLQDYRGDLIRLYQAAGFIFHSEVCIWKDPVQAMHRTKSIRLLYKQLKKDSAMSGQSLPDYLITMRKPGDNTEPITKDPDEFPVEMWQRYASPVWMHSGGVDDEGFVIPKQDIDPNDTLQTTSAKEHKDERHICPLQFQVIERAIRLWTNPDDLVLSPFMGIGSEGYVALKMGRKFIGFELKPSYYNQAVKNLEAAALLKDRKTMFDLIDEAV